MSAENPWLLFLLALLVPGFLLWRSKQRKREERLKLYTESGFRDKLFMGDSPKLRQWHFMLIFSALFILFLSVSGPQSAGKKEKVKNTGIDIMMVIDVSNSMLAQDLSPNRIERAKLAILDMIPKMGDDRLGIVVFAGQSFTNLPLTSDLPAAEMLVNSISPDMISMQGTDIGPAIDQAVNSFSSDDKDRGKAIIVISDGENHEADPLPAVDHAVEKGIIVSCIGIGSTTGTKIPMFDANGQSLGNKKDESGNDVVTKLDETLLQNIASEGKGMYVKATPGDMGLATVYNSLQGLSKTTKETWHISSYTPLYQWFILAAAILLLVELFIKEGHRNEEQRF
ncbi:MAG TPA: VWA domain-containing protein [Bacteroidia bacterium]|jgi:Ca-activated chloride channel family protein|nr:VWA domain-containing protein [Bacteroidia bacterium]